MSLQIRNLGKRYGDNVVSLSFDRTFAFIAILSALGIIPAFFLKRPEKREHSVAAAA